MAFLATEDVLKDKRIDKGGGAVASYRLQAIKQFSLGLLIICK